MENKNYYVRQMEGSLFVICEGDEPKKQDYIVGDNNALVKESYFIDFRKWESNKMKYECISTQVGEFLKLVSKGNYNLEFYEDLAEGILIPSNRVKIDNGFAYLIDEEMNMEEYLNNISSVWGFSRTSDYEHFKKDMIENFKIIRIKQND